MNPFRTDKKAFLHWEGISDTLSAAQLSFALLMTLVPIITGTCESYLNAKTVFGLEKKDTTTVTTMQAKYGNLLQSGPSKLSFSDNGTTIGVGD